MARWKTEPGGDGYQRKRFVGRTRGAQGVIKPAIIDLGHAVNALTAARVELETALATTDERQRERLLVDARARVALGIRFATQVIAGRKPPRKRPAKAQLKLGIR